MTFIESIWSRYKTPVVMGLVVLVCFAVYVAWHSFQSSKPSADAPRTKTGALISSPNAYQANEMLLEEKLVSQLPYRGNGFVITFDYGMNAFVVSPATKGDTTYGGKFVAWLQSSEFAQLRPDAFIMK